MPAPTPSFEEFFGVGAVPIGDYFDGPALGSRDRRFAPEARGLLQQQEQYAREQSALDAEMAAEQLLNEAPNLSDAQINDRLLQNPRTFGTQAAGPLSGYMKFRQAVVPAGRQDVTLGPQYLMEIKDPRHRDNFQRRMLQEGYSANDALSEYYVDLDNDKHTVELAELGVPDEEFSSLKNPEGRFDPAAVARRKARAQAEAKKRSTPLVTPLDEEIEVLKDAVKYKAEILGDKADKDPLYNDLRLQLESAYQKKLQSLQAPSALGAPTPTTRAPSAFLEKFKTISEIPVKKE